jgi:hypothetical protein
VEDAAAVEEAQVLLVARVLVARTRLTLRPAVKRKLPVTPTSPDKAVAAGAGAAEASPECPSSEAEAVVAVAADSVEAVACRSTPEPTWSA